MTFILWIWVVLLNHPRTIDTTIHTPHNDSVQLRIELGECNYKGCTIKSFFDCGEGYIEGDSEGPLRFGQDLEVTSDNLPVCWYVGVEPDSEVIFD